MDPWSEFESELNNRCRALADGTFFIVEGPARTKERIAGLFGRKRRTQEVHLFAQYLRMGNVLYAELVGGSHVGGDFPWTDAEDAALRRLGWQAPEAEKAAPMYGAYFPAQAPAETDLYLPGTLGEEAAALVTHSLMEVAGVGHPRELRITTT
ncbi:TY-Chap domain-containing protein [Pseudactinotalea sp. Z1732]|uniref:TY-Chap domain-containing protein n=1 Tax=Micrococcales TaxID=85006 RepID=UPI003C7B469C